MRGALRPPTGRARLCAPPPVADAIQMWRDGALGLGLRRVLSGGLRRPGTQEQLQALGGDGAAPHTRSSGTPGGWQADRGVTEQLKAGERPERVKPRGVVVGSGYFPLKAGPGGAVRVTGRLVVQGGGSHD